MPETSITPAKPIRHHKPAIEQLHEKLYILTDDRGASQIVGLTDANLMKLIAEVGADMDPRKSQKHFTS